MNRDLAPYFDTITLQPTLGLLRLMDIWLAEIAYPSRLLRVR